MYMPSIYIQFMNPAYSAPEAERHGKPRILVHMASTDHLAPSSLLDSVVYHDGAVSYPSALSSSAMSVIVQGSED